MANIAIIPNSQGAASSKMLYSPDGGSSWLEIVPTDRSAIIPSITSVCSDGTQFLMSTYTGRVLSSTDGLVWTDRASVSPRVGHLIWTGTTFVGFDGSTVFLSTDGTTWSSYTISVTNLVLTDIAWNG